MSACGGVPLSDEEFATVEAELGPGGGGGSGEGGGVGSGPGGSPGGGNAAQNKFGTLEIPCGTGDTSAYTASDKGVTKDSITITVIPSTTGLVLTAVVMAKAG